MDPKRESIPDAGAYRVVEIVLRDLESAERVPGNTERALHLGAIRSAIVELRTVVPPVET